MLSPKLSLLAFLIGFVSSVSGGLFAKGVAATVLGSASGIFEAMAAPAPVIAAASLVIGLPLLALMLHRFIGRVDAV
jgi:hypothetical protein